MAVITSCALTHQKSLGKVLQSNGVHEVNVISCQQNPVQVDQEARHNNIEEDKADNIRENASKRKSKEQGQFIGVVDKDLKISSR
ncbi:hypothetical protein M8J77_003796 [Diaphorina citri]|nr:hypothetical protein M8J77_003796 [Diaphorina citri]